MSADDRREVQHGRRAFLGRAGRGLALLALAGGALALAWRNGAGVDCAAAGACADCRQRAGCSKRRRSENDGR